jgi:hypothetical protein
VPILVRFLLLQKIAGFSAAAVLITVFALGIPSYLIISFDPATGNTSDGWGRLLVLAPWWTWIIPGVDEYWPGWTWFIIDMVLFWGGIGLATLLGSFAMNGNKMDSETGKCE